MSRRVGSRGIEQLRDDLSGRDHAIVRQVADLRLMSGGQIERIYFSPSVHANGEAGARACRRVLGRLTRDGLIVRLDRRIGGMRAGSSAFIYALGPVGHRLIGDGRTARPRPREPSLAFMDHTLAIAELVVQLTTYSRRVQTDVTVLQTEPWCWRHYSVGLGSEAVLRPDLFVAIGRGDFEFRYFVEVDRGTEHLPTLLRKCVAFDAYYRSGREQAEHDVFPTVLWVMSTVRRVEQLSRAIQRDRRITDAMFHVVLETDAVATLAQGAAP